MSASALCHALCNAQVVPECIEHTGCDSAYIFKTCLKQSVLLSFQHHNPYRHRIGTYSNHPLCTGFHVLHNCCELQQHGMLLFAVNCPTCTTATCRYCGPDAADLFWLGRPRITLWLYQGTYFACSLLAALLIFSEWKHLPITTSAPGGWQLGVAIVGLNVVFMVSGSLCVLPVYALTMAAGSHCPDSILEFARRKNIKPQLVQ